MTTDEITRVWAGDVLKWDQTPEGLMVHGVAASPALDMDAQICDPTWLKAAMPDWMRWGNVREQHANIAAGIGKTLEAGEGDKWSLDALVVDQGTQAKVKAGVLKGYSVGIKRAQVVKDAGAPNGRIVGGKIVEVSLVDRPCNPEATLALAKAEGGALAPVDQAGVVLHVIEDDATKAETAEPAGQAPKVRSAKILTPSAHRKALATMQKVLSGDIAKYDEAGDIASAQQVLSILADLIISEATEMKTGNRPEEYYDIQTLMQACGAVRSFLRAEQDQATQAPDSSGSDVGGGISYAMLAANGETTKAPEIPAPRSAPDDADKAAKPITMPDGSYPISDQHSLDSAAGLAGKSKTYSVDQVQSHVRSAAAALGLSLPDSYAKAKNKAKGAKTKTATPDVDKAAGPGDTGLAELIKSAVAEATTDLLKRVESAEDTTKALEAELVKVKATPIPGAPIVLSATRGPAQASPLTEVARLRKQADQISDPDTARGYRELADRKEKAALASN